MADMFTSCGKQVLMLDCDFAQARDEDAAKFIVTAMNEHIRICENIINRMNGQPYSFTPSRDVCDSAIALLYSDPKGKK